MNLTALIAQLARDASDLWFVALVGSFFVMICEAAKPKPAEGESRAGPFTMLVGVLSLLTPLLLFAHAFIVSGRSSEALIAIIAVLGGAIVAAAIIGWTIQAAAPAIGRTLSKAAPVLALAMFALAAYVSWESVLALANQLIAGGA